MKDLVIAEKPSVASDIARALGGFVRKEDYWESDTVVISSAVGHLLTITPPEDFEVKRGKWSFKNLPAIPPYFALSPIKKTATRLKLLQKLLKRKDISTVVNACDAGREGELIFRYIIEFSKSKLPIKRLWLNSMTTDAIVKGFTHLKSDQELRPLFDAARCRSEADWLIGINSTRAMTAFNSQEGGFFLTTVGRVQTPTLSLVVHREEEIKNFKPSEYFEIYADFEAAKGVYRGKWFDPEVTKGRADRLSSKEQVEQVLNACVNKKALVYDEVKPSVRNSPQLFDLTTLQREANNRFGFTAKTTLSLLQALYERHKMLTYPRTNSKCLPEDYVDTARNVVAALGAESEYQKHTAQIQKANWVKPNKRIFNNRKVDDHFAIIPTEVKPKKTLSEAEQKLYRFVVQRFLAVFFPAAQYEITTRKSVVTEQGKEHTFKTEAKVLVEPGWLSVYGKEALLEDGEVTDWVSVDAGDRVEVQNVEFESQFTKPPARYTEASLLSAMESAGKEVENEELREAMQEKGLGTPATRATIIEGLVKEEYLIREARNLVPMPKAFQLIVLLRGLKVAELIAPELTGEWEYKLGQIEKGEIERASFMKEIVLTTEKIVEQAKNNSHATVEGDFIALQTPCPHCSGIVKETYRRFQCQKCDFSISKNPGGRTFAVDEVETLLQQREIGPLTGFRSKQGWPFSAKLLIVEGDEGMRLEFDFGKRETKAFSHEELASYDKVGVCLKCGGQVVSLPQHYACENQANGSEKCDFKVARIILQQEITPEQVGKLLAKGSTDLLTGFISQRTNRPFKAFLQYQKSGKLGFVFEQKTPAKGKKTAAKKASTKARAG